MKSFFDSSPPLLLPEEFVKAITKKSKEELALPKRAIFSFDRRYIEELARILGGRVNENWRPLRRIFHVGEDLILTSSFIGGPHVSMVVEELSAFGVKEFIFLGLCGGLQKVGIGDILLAKGAIREEGTSYHYLEDLHELICSKWAERWREISKKEGIKEGIVLSLDAPYRETKRKIEGYKKKGVLGVEMEVASFYALCEYKRLLGVAFLVVSDLFFDESWIPAFYSPEFERGREILKDFVLRYGIKGP